MRDRKREIKRIAKRICRRLFYCKHNYMPHRSIQDGRRRRTIWKCTRCGKEKIGI